MRVAGYEVIKLFTSQLLPRNYQISTMDLDMKEELNVGLIGLSFMGRAHTNAWIDVPFHFDLPFRPVRKVACDKVGDMANAFAEKFSWNETATDWEKVVKRDDIHVIDICTSN